MNLKLIFAFLILALPAWAVPPIQVVTTTGTNDPIINKIFTSDTMNGLTAVSGTVTGNVVRLGTTTGGILVSPTVTTPTGIVKGDVGLGNVDNTSDVNKPVSTAQAAVIVSSSAVLQTQINARVVSGGTGAVLVSPTLTTPSLGVPTALTLTNATGLSVSTGIVGLGSGIATFLATPSSVNLATAITNETGSGPLVFATSPVLVTPSIGDANVNSLSGPTWLVNADSSASFGHSGFTIDDVGNSVIGSVMIGINGDITASKFNGNTITPGAGTMTLGSFALTTAQSGTLTSNAFSSVTKPTSAKGDGTTDDTTAFQADLSSLSAKGGTLVLGSGTYKLTATILVSGNNITISGQGRATTILAVGNYGDVIQFTLPVTPTSWPGMRGAVRDLTIQSSVARTSGAAILMTYTHNAEISNVQIGMTANMSPLFYDGIHCDGQDQVRCLNNEINASHYCIWAVGHSIGAAPASAFGMNGFFENNWTWDGLSDYNAGSIGFYIQNCGGASFLNAAAVGMETGYSISGAGSSGSVEVFMLQANADGVGGDGIVLESITQAQLTTCWAAGCGRSGAGTNGGTGLVTTSVGNLMLNGLKSYSNGTGCSIDASTAAIVGGQFSSNSTDIILSSNVGQATVTGNAANTLTNNSSGTVKISANTGLADSGGGSVASSLMMQPGDGSYVNITGTIPSPGGFGGGSEVALELISDINGGAFPALVIQSLNGGGAIQFVDSTNSPIADFGADPATSSIGIVNRIDGGIINFDTNLGGTYIPVSIQSGTVTALYFAGDGSAVTGVTLAHITGFATGMPTFLATPSSANLAGSVTDETGSGKLVFATSPTLITPSLGVATCTSISGNGSGITSLNASNVASGVVPAANLPGGHALSTYAAGTVYSMTASDALVHFGTTDPTTVIDQAGTYLVMGRAYLKYNGATYVGSQTTTLHLQRTNNTPATITKATTTATLRIVSTITDTVGVMEIPAVIYTTTNTNDSLSVYGSVSATPAAGSVDCTEASIVAVRLY